MNRRIVILICVAVSLLISTVNAAPTTQPVALVITAGGTYANATYSNVTIHTTDPVVLNRLTIVGPGAPFSGTKIHTSLVTSSKAPDLTITNCTFSTDATSYAVACWSFSRFVFEHNSLKGTAGVLMMDRAPSQVHIRFNSGTDISGALTPTTKEKASFIQLDETHCDDIEIAWNAVVNHPGTSAVEDAISFMQSGGTPTSPALIHDNFVDGAFAYPHNGGNFSGSGIMCYDPGVSAGLTIGGYTHCYNNIVIGVENCGIDCAGSHDVEIDNNHVVNDGTTTTKTNVGIRTWNWADTNMKPTPLSVFGHFNVHDNTAFWFAGTKRLDWGFTPLPPHTTLSNNLSITDSDDAERNAWRQKVAKADFIIGLAPDTSLATGQFSAMKYAQASAGAQLVPLPAENLGVPTSVGYLRKGSWLKYASIDFSEGVSSFTVNLGSPLAAQSFDVHVDSAAGPIIATVKIADTGGWYEYKPTTVPTATVTGIHDVFLAFGGSANIESFTFATPIAAPVPGHTP
jgi:hypothetical protein